MKKLLTTLAGLSLTAVSFAGPSPDQVEITDLAVGGPGCPQGTTDFLITSTTPGGPADFFEVVFDSFLVEKGPGVSRTQKRKHCTIAAQVHFPQGYSFSLMEVHYEGWAELPIGSRGILKSEYFFPFYSNRVSIRKELQGPFEDDYDKNDTLGVFNSVWSPCGREVPLNIKSTLELRGPQDDPAVMSVDLTTGLLTQKWALSWRKCTEDEMRDARDRQSPIVIQ